MTTCVKGQELILNVCYSYKGGINSRLRIVEEIHDHEYPDYILYSEDGEFMYSHKNWEQICMFTVELLNGVYA